MSTRSIIAFDNGDEISSIYCHFDGYLDGVGLTLHNHYSDIEKVEELMDLGDISILGREIGYKQEWIEASQGIDFKRNPAWCLAYGRDRGETDNKALSHDSLQGLLTYFYGSDCDYLYVFDGYGWSYAKPKPSGKRLTLEDLIPCRANVISKE
jgi:hypothetical protein